MNKDSRNICESYTQIQRMQKTATTDFHKDEVVDGLAQMVNNLDNAGVISLFKALKEFLPKEDFSIILQKLSDKVDHEKMRAAGNLVGSYNREVGRESSIGL